MWVFFAHSHWVSNVLRNPSTHTQTHTVWVSATQMWNAEGLELQSPLSCSAALPCILESVTHDSYCNISLRERGTILLQHLKEKRNGRKSVLNIDSCLAAWLHRAYLLDTIFPLFWVFYSVYCISLAVMHTYAENQTFIFNKESSVLWH